MKKGNDEASSQLPKLVVVAVILGLAVLPVVMSSCNRGAGGGGEEASDSTVGEDSAPPDTIPSIVASEELILELTPKLKWLAKDVMNLRFPDFRGKKLFADNVEVYRLEETGTSTPVSTVSVSDTTYAASSRSTKLPGSRLTLWQPFLGAIEFFDHAKFYFVRGEFLDTGMRTFDSDMGFAAQARGKNGDVIAVASKLQVQWARFDKGASGEKNSAEEADWRITKWKIKNFEVSRIGETLFEEVLARAIPDLETRERATRSLHQEFFVALLRGETTTRSSGETGYTLFFPDVTFEHPGLSVVDIDSDGWDDLYFCVMRGRNLLLRNRGDGTFEDVAPDYGLDIEGGSTSALFADFDNDGDADLLLGRGRHRAMYLARENNEFVDRSETHVSVELPYLVSSASATDYNGDGMLDLYLCTYSPIEGGQGTVTDNPKWVDFFLTEDQKVEFLKQRRQAHAFLGMVGPPNLLLVNAGDGKFEVSPFSEQLRGWRKCFQSSWSDCDNDGDPDLYLSNDFSPDQFWRNEGEAGFVDVTEQLGLDHLGFGMGVTWGDYNNDSQMDVYASNMFSKAGSRITAQIPGIDERLQAIARGNYLYQSDAGKFVLKSGTPDEAIPVSHAGWSWGGQFADFNNDSFLDLYVASGYHTVPPEIAIDIDL